MMKDQKQNLWTEEIKNAHQNLQEKRKKQTQAMQDKNLLSEEQYQEAFKAERFFQIEHTQAKDFFQTFSLPVWEYLPLIPFIIESLLKNISQEDYLEVAPKAFVHKSVKISKNAEIHGPCLIGEGSEIRSGAYIRGNVLVGKKCVLGNSCEFKNCILFDEATVPHYSYVGDAILGYKAHLGAGASLANLKLDRREIVLRYQTMWIPTGLRKMGSIVGDACEIGGSVHLSPGTLLEPEVKVLPLRVVQGFHARGTWVGKETQVSKEA